MRLLSNGLLQDLWFRFVMVLTGFLPEILPILKLRGFLVKPSFRKCGKNLQITKDVRINQCHNISLGDDVFFSAGVWILASEAISIESEVMMGPYSILVTGDHTRSNGSFRFGPAERAPITLGFGVWVGAHAVVSKGVEIGSGTVLAAGSVATKSIPAMCVAGGLPAKIIKNENINV